MRKIERWLSAGAALVVLSGCGTTVPLKDPLVENTRDPSSGYSHEGRVEANIVGNIRCEIQNALLDADKLKSMPYLGRSWGTQITMKLTWDEQSGLTPNFSSIKPLQAMQSFVFTAGASASAHSTRVETVTFFLQNPALLAVAKEDDRQGVRRDCTKRETGPFIESDLRIGEFVYDKATIADTHLAQTTASSPVFSTFQEDLTFVGTLGGNVTPTWKLTRLSADTNPNLASATRSVTGDVLITLGPMAQDKYGNYLARLSTEPASQHTAGVIGGSVASQVKSQSSM